MIYKPSIYNGNGVYNGDGIYKGGGVYNDGYYPGYIQVGSLIWATKNLDIEVSAGNYQQVPWPDSGKLYKGSCIDTEITPSLTDGWRVPTTSDFQNLRNTCAVNSYYGAPNIFWCLAIADNSYNQYYNGQYLGDTIGFSAYMTGYKYYSNPISNARKSCNFWTQSKYGSNIIDWCLQNGNSFIDMSHNGDDYFLCIRLCKDA